MRRFPLLLVSFTVAYYAVICDDTYALNSQTANTGVITPILFEIDAILNTLLDELKFLVGQPLEVILLSVDGTVVLTVAEVAQLISTLLFVSSSLESSVNVF